MMCRKRAMTLKLVTTDLKGAEKLFRVRCASPHCAAPPCPLGPQKKFRPRSDPPTMVMQVAYVKCKKGKAVQQRVGRPLCLPRSFNA